jgi:glycerol-3-phosphate acyltransferase
MAKKKLSQRLLTTLLSIIFHGRPWLSSTTSSKAFPSSPLRQKQRHPLVADDKLAEDRTIVVDVDGGLLRSSSSGLFPYFMLVALEAGGFLRGALLLLLYPLLCLMGIGGDAALRVMAVAASGRAGSAPAAPCCPSGSWRTWRRKRSRR